MAEQQQDKGPVTVRSKYGLPTIEEVRKRQASGKPVETTITPETDEEKVAREEWDKKNVFQKLGAKADVGWHQMVSGLERTAADLAPALFLPGTPVGNIMGGAEEAYISSQFLKQKAREQLQKAEDVKAIPGDWTDIATMAPMLGGIVASAGLGAVTGGSAWSAIPAIIGQGTVGALTAQAYGNSLLEQEIYDEKTGHETPELQKRAVALIPAVAMVIGGKMMGGAVNKLNKVLGDAIASPIMDNPTVATNIISKWLADKPGASAKLLNLAKVTGKETLTSAGAMAIITAASDLAANIDKYPEDRQHFGEIVMNTLKSAEGGAALGLLLGPLAAGTNSMYNYMRRKKAGINLVSTSDGEVFERIGNHPTDPNKVTVMDQNMNFKDIPKEKIVDNFSMTMAEKEKLLDAWKTHKEAVPGIAEAIKLNNVRKQADAMAVALSFGNDLKSEVGIGTASKIGRTVFVYEVNGEKFFVKAVSDDLNLASLMKVVPQPDGTYKIEKFMVKNFDYGKTSSVPVKDFSDELFRQYTTTQAPEMPKNADGTPMDPLTRQANEDAAKKVTKVGDQITYEGRKWDVNEVTMDGTVKVTEVKENGEPGEYMEIPADRVKDINQPIEEPAPEEVKVGGKTIAKKDTPVYEKDGVPVDRDYIEGALEMAEKPEDLYGFRFEGDDKLDALYKKKFPENVTYYKIGGKEVSAQKAKGAILHAPSLEALSKIKVNLDTEMQKLLDDRIKMLTPVKPEAPQGSDNITTPKSDEKAAPAAESTPAAPAVADKLPTIKPKEGNVEITIPKSIQTEQEIQDFLKNELPVGLPYILRGIKYTRDEKGVLHTEEVGVKEIQENAPKETAEVGKSPSGGIGTKEEKPTLASTKEVPAGETPSGGQEAVTPSEAAPVAGVEAKKADIEKRRQEELNAVDKQSGEKRREAKPSQLAKQEQEALEKGIAILKRIGYSQENQRIPDDASIELEESGFNNLSTELRNLVLKGDIEGARAKVWKTYEQDVNAKYDAELKALESPIEQRAREAREEAEGKIDYRAFHAQVTQAIKEPQTNEEKLAMMDQIEKGVEKAGWKFEVDPDEDPDFASVNVFYKGQSSSPDEMQPTMLKLFKVYSRLLHETHEGPRIVPGGLKSESEIKAELEAARKDVHPNPSDAQKEAGNYPKGHVNFYGLTFGIETAKGGIRKGTDPNGKDWEIKMKNDYGHILGTIAPDGEPVDVIIGEIKSGQKIYIIDQIKPATGEYDEPKVLAGFDSEWDARAGYLQNYEPGWKGLGEITEVPVDQFKVLVKDKFNTTKPVEPSKWTITPDYKYFNNSWLSTENTSKNVKGKTEEPIQPTGPTEGKTEGNNDSGSTTGVIGGTPEEGKGIFTGILKVVHDRFKKEIEGDYEGYKAKYLAMPEVRLGESIVLSGDLAKSLSPDYRANKTEFSQAVHDPASDFIKKLYDDLIQQPAPSEGRNYVLMTAGGTGVGKTTTMNEFLEDRKESPPYLIYDSNMANFDTSKDRIEKALQFGKEVDLLFVWRDPFNAYMYGVVPRMREERRSIGVGVHIKTTAKSLDNIKKLYDLYKENENITFRFVDNDTQTKVNPEDIFSKTINELDLRRRITDELESRKQQGKLTQEETGILLGQPHAETPKQVSGETETGGSRGTETPAEVTPSKPEFAGQSVGKYSPFDNWDKNLFASRDYAAHLFTTDELDALKASGKLVWNKLETIVAAIKEKLAANNLQVISDLFEGKPVPKSEFAGEHLNSKDALVSKYVKKLTEQNLTESLQHEKEQGRTPSPEEIEKARNRGTELHTGTFKKLQGEIDRKDFEALKKRYFYSNKTWRAFFEEYTGFKLGKTQKDIEKNLGIFTAKGFFGTENQTNFDKNLTNEGDKGIPDTSGVGTSEVDAGTQTRQTGGALPSGEAAGLPEQTGGESGKPDQQPTEGRENQADGGGGSDRELTGTGEGAGPSGMVEGTPGEDTGNRTKPEDLASFNHVIRPEDIVVPKGEITKIRANLSAISLLVKLEKADRNATPEEKQVLSKYTGWGGLAPVLDQYKYRMRQWEPEWNKKYGDFHEKLLTLLSPEEFRSAINSTINAHYTSIPIIREMWSLAEHLGFRGGNALEPAGGIGHFIGAIPEHLARRTAFTSYELDSVSGRILRKLYPEAAVLVRGYQESNVPDLSQDLIITNVPFAKEAPFDAKNKDLSKFSLHNYFIAKGIRQLKPGGIGMFITSSSTMDNPASAKFREWVVTEGNADFVGGIRLPNNAFKENAGTEVTTDILVFRKRTSDVPSEYAQDFRITDVIGTGKGDYGQTLNIEVNKYFVDHPDNILGKMMIAADAGSGGLYSGNSQTAAPIKDLDLITAIEERIKSFPEKIMDTGISKRTAKKEIASAEDKDGTLINKSGNIYEVAGGELVPTPWNDEKIKVNGKEYQARKIAADYLALKEATNKLLDIERDIKSTDADIAEAKKTLNTLYDNFIKNYKAINRNKALEFLEDDSEFNMVSGLEDINVEVKMNKLGRPMRSYSIVKSPIFKERVNFPVVEPTEADTIEDAFSISLGYRNKVDLDYIATLVGSSPDQVSAELIKEGFAFRNPKTGLLEEKDEYLSGYVKTKYNEAVKAAKEDPSYDVNVAALAKVLPKDIPGQIVKFRLGTPWIPSQIISDFIKATTDLEPAISWVPGVEKWSVERRRHYYSAKNNTSGAGGMTGIQLIEHALHLSRPRVMVKGPGEDKPHLDPEATAAAVGKMEELMDNFVNFVYDNPDYVKQIETIYNRDFNTFIEKKQSLPKFDFYPGANHAINLYIHQRKGIERAKKGSLLLAHQVGTGKTFTLITTVMEMRRLNLAKKPMVVVQNATIEQFTKAFKTLYPSAKLLVAEKNDSKPKKRQRIFNKISYGDWDAIVIPQSFLNFIPDDPAREKAYLDEKIAELTEIRDAAKADGGSYGNPIFSAAQDAITALEKKMEEAKEKRSKKVKDVAKGNISVEKKVKTQLSRRKDDVRTFEKMGVDALLVDEAHAYKKLGFATAMSNVRGIDTKGSQRALSLLLKIRHIQERMSGRNVILSTGTPISNTMAEVWTMMNYIAPEVLKAYHIETFDKFASTYGKVEPSLEFTASGKFKTVDRFKSYQNAPELMLAFRANTDVVLTEDVPEFKAGNTIPKLKDGKFTQIIIPQTPGLTNMMARFKTIMEEWEALPGKEKREKRHIPLVVFGRAKQAAIDLRLISPDFSGDPGSKTNACIKEVMRIYKESENYKGTQVIFCDMYQSPERAGETRFNLYQDIKRKLMSEGIPEGEIEIISDQADAKREDIFDKFNDGDIRILMGSTEKLGTGVNIQVLLAAVHHMDAPPRPMDFEQRNGRIIRQGNTHADMGIPIQVITYGVEKTLDATAYQRLAIKQKFINQMMKGEGLDRDVADAAEEEMATDLTFDQMMATLSGSQYAILLYQKEYDLRKLQTAYRSYERTMIESKASLQYEKEWAQKAVSRVAMAKQAEKKLQENFKDGKITSLTVSWKGGKPVEIFKGNERKDVPEKLLPYLKKLAEDSLNTSADIRAKTDLMTKKERYDYLDKVSLPKLYVSVNGFNGTIVFNESSLTDSWRSKFDYKIPVLPDMYKDISSSFSEASGFVVSVEAQTSKMIETLVPDEEKNLNEHTANIPIYEEALKKTFDKGDKLQKLIEDVADLKAKISKEAEDNKGKGNLPPEDSDLDIPLDDGPEPVNYIRKPKEPDFSEDLPAIWDSPQYPKYRVAPGSFAGDEVMIMKEHEFMRRAQAMSDYTGVPIEVVRTKNDLPEFIKKDIQRRFGRIEDQSIPGLYHKGRVWSVIEDTKSVSEFVSNMSHEIFAHHGLVALLGKEQYLKVLQLVYRGMSPVDISQVSYNYDVPETDWETIAEEHLGNMAGNNEINPTLWQRIVAAIRELIRKLYNIAMSKSEIINLLRKSRENLTKNKPAPDQYTNIGEYLDALTAYTTNPGKTESSFGYGIQVSESKALNESVSQGNMDYSTYFGVAKSLIGSKSAEWIERALVRNDFDSERAIDYLSNKMTQYERFERHYNMVRDARDYLSDNEPKNPSGLYKVLVGKGKTPQELNFLTWDKPVDYNEQESIMNQLDVEGKYDISIQGSFLSGESIYNKVTSIYGSEREASLFLSRAGIDGMKKEKGYVIYDNTPVEVINQIKYQRAQKPVFVGEHLANAAKVYTDQAVTERNWRETLNGMREVLQDMSLPVRKFEEEVIKRGGLQPNDAKPYRDISLAFGRQETLYKDFVRNKMKPIIETVVKIIRSGIQGENILPYIISKHAIERNRVFRARELDEFMNRKTPNDPTPEEIDAFREAIADKDYAGVTAFDVNKEFVSPDELAQTIADEFEAAVPKALVDELWDRIRVASSATLDYWEAGQQLSPEQKQFYLEQFKNFVPLRGWRDGAAKDLVYIKGEGFKKSLMHAEGRKSLADNPLVHMQDVAFKAIGEQVDNEVKTSMLRLLMRNLQSADLYDLATVKKLYYIRVDLPDGSHEWEPTLDRPPQAMFENGEATTKIYNEYQKLRVPVQAREHEVVVRRQGGDVVMVFKGKMLPVAQTMNKRNFMYHNIFGHVKDARVMNQAATTLAYMNNFLKAAYTSWNIVFPFTNFMRDFQEASITQLIKGDAGHKVIANYTRAFPSIVRFLRGKLDMNNPDDVKLRDFYTIGGATGFTHLLSAEDLEKNLNDEINRMVARGTVRGEVKNMMHNTVQIVSMWNQVFEDATRFSVYLTSIDLGKSKEDAASDAKEASVNFNRKGKTSKLYDAIYAFWNVAWQSLQKNFKLGKDFPKAFSAVASAFMALGFLEALLNKATDDEDPENDYYNINPYMRENYLILPNLPRLIAGESKGNKYLSIPLPQFWRGFKSVGSLAFDLTQDRVKVGEAISKALLNFGSAMSPIDVGGFGRSGEFSFAPLVPTVAKPFYEIAINRNYMGYTIAKEPFDRSQEKLLANARLGKDNVNPAAKFFTDMLFRWGGGDNNTKFFKSKSGVEKEVWTEKLPATITNPSYVEHLFKGFTGGTGAVFSDLITTISQAIAPDQEVNFKNVPFVNKFIRQTPEAKWNIIADYYNLKDAVSVHSGLKRAYKQQAEAGGDSSQIEATEGSSYYEEYQSILESYDKDIKEIGDQVDFTDIEGTAPIYALMKQCIDDIKNLKLKYQMK
jgi:N12 class adenine-specific DNA methylase